jgi:tetratricopeptide (TPR) repeat protein
MKIKLLFFCLLPLIAFSQSDNDELKKMYKEDQDARQVTNINWDIVSKKDAEHRARVHELQKERKIITAKDNQRAAMIFQHGEDSNSYFLAVMYMKKAIELDSNINKWLLAAATDRYLLSANKPQIYGTQFTKKEGSNKWVLAKMDSFKVSDVERQKFGVPSLNEISEQQRQMNIIRLEQVYLKPYNLKDIYHFIKSERKNGENSEYGVDEHGINTFGYFLMGENKLEEALAIFQLNVELYPKGANTYDSLGECLMKMGKKQEGLIAYKKSLELDSSNSNAKKILDEAK